MINRKHIPGLAALMAFLRLDAAKVLEDAPRNEDPFYLTEKSGGRAAQRRLRQGKGRP